MVATLEIPPLLAGFDWSNGLAVGGFVVAVLASALALRHLYAIRLVQQHIEEAQAKTQENVGATEDLQQKIEENLDKTEDLRQQTLAALELHEVVVQDPTLSEWASDVAANFVAIQESHDKLLYKLAVRDLRKSGDFMKMGASGRITIPADEFRHAATLATILLETTEQDDEFWASSLVHAAFWESANAYLQQQRERIANKVTINRVFVFETEEAANGAHAQQQMEHQHAAKINVKYDIRSPYSARDLVVVRKPSSVTGLLEPVYAMECKLGRGRRIEHVEFWYANDLQLETVTAAWRDLEQAYEDAKVFPPDRGEILDRAPSHPATQLLQSNLGLRPASSETPT